MRERQATLATALSISRYTEREMAKAVAVCARAAAREEHRLAELTAYLSEYDQEEKDSVHATRWCNRRTFVARLAQAVEQQRARTQDAHRAHEATRREWLEKVSRVKRLETVLSKRAFAEQKRGQRREQRESDDRPFRV